jgi:hypothetical protein
MTDLQIEYKWTLVEHAKIPRSLAQRHALNASDAEMKIYIMHHLPKCCTCTNNGDLCERCTALEITGGNHVI